MFSLLLSLALAGIHTYPTDMRFVLEPWRNKACKVNVPPYLFSWTFTNDYDYSTEGVKDFVTEENIRDAWAPAMARLTYHISRYYRKSNAQFPPSFFKNCYANTENEDYGSYVNIYDAWTRFINKKIPTTTQYTYPAEKGSTHCPSTSDETDEWYQLFESNRECYTNDLRENITCPVYVIPSDRVARMWLYEVAPFIAIMEYHRSILNYTGKVYSPLNSEKQPIGYMPVVVTGFGTFYDGDRYWEVEPMLEIPHAYVGNRVLVSRKAISGLIDTTKVAIFPKGYTASACDQPKFTKTGLDFNLKQ